jgi:hypothetical protein
LGEPCWFLLPAIWDAAFADRLFSPSVLRCLGAATIVASLKKANAADALFQRFDAALRAAGFLAMSGQIIADYGDLFVSNPKILTARLLRVLLRKGT